MTASKIELSPTPTQQVAGISEEIKQAKEDLPVENLYGKESKIGYTAPIESGKPTVKIIAGGIKVNLQPGQVLEKGDAESKLEELVSNGEETAKALSDMTSNLTALAQTSKATLDKSNESNAARGDKGADYMTAVAALEPFIFDGTFFDYPGLKNVSIPSLRIAPKVLLKAKAGLGPVKATQVRDYFTSKGYPKTKEEWQEWSKANQTDKAGE